MKLEHWMALFTFVFVAVVGITIVLTGPASEPRSHLYAEQSWRQGR